LAEQIIGMDALIRRMRALGETQPLLRALQLSTIHEAQALAEPFSKSHFLQRNILPGPLTKDYAIVDARAPYSLFVERGTGLYGPKHRKIVPQSGKFFAWRVGQVTLTGRSRVSGGQETAGWAFSWHGTKGRPATPFLIPGAKAAVGKAGVGSFITQWNNAA
jgi:hypothetical protein